MVVAFVSGPQQAACYVACKYGTSAYGLQQYMQLYPDVNAVYAALYGSPLCSSFSGIAVDNGPFDEQESALDNIFATATSDVSQVSTAFLKATQKLLKRHPNAPLWRAPFGVLWLLLGPTDAQLWSRPTRWRGSSTAGSASPAAPSPPGNLWPRLRLQ